MLKYSEYTFTEISYYLVLSSYSHFAGIFPKYNHFTPKKYRKKYFRKAGFAEKWSLYDGFVGFDPKITLWTDAAFRCGKTPVMVEYCYAVLMKNPDEQVDSKQPPTPFAVKKGICLKMNRKSEILSISFILVCVFAISYFALNGGYYGIDKIGDEVKEVRKIPTGFVSLNKGRDDEENNLSFVLWESQVSVLDADESCIYQTSIGNSNFIVKFNEDLYVNEKKLLELTKIANSASEQLE